MMKMIKILTLVFALVGVGYANEIPPGVINPTLMPPGLSKDPYMELPQSISVDKSSVTYPTYQSTIISAINTATTNAQNAADAYIAQWNRISGLLDGMNKIETDPETFEDICDFFAFGRDQLKSGSGYMDGDEYIAAWIETALGWYNASTNDTEAAYYRDMILGLCDSRNSGHSAAMSYINSAEYQFDQVEGYLPY